ncbi:hypothetical protein GGR57DRAFT_313768 [Xylariaceae sp. FL1272]|nr:hypothetical protein GGR57DRAFT_313768 [Xylariaceae sp. FL1272]
MISTSIYAPIPITTGYSGTRIPTGLGAVLTIFTPAPECSDQWFSASDYVWSDNQHDPSWANCQPFGATAGAFSPGVCPSGQEFKNVEVLTSDNGVGTTMTYYDGRCCYSEFAWYNSTWTIARSDIDQALSLTTAILACVSSFGPGKEYSVWTPGGAEDPQRIKLNSTMTALGTYIHIYWNESDLSSLATPLAASLRVAMGLPAYPPSSASNPSTSLPSATASNDTEGSGTRISGGAIAGIVIGVVAVLLLIAILGFLALSRRWRKQRKPESDHGSHGPCTHNQHSLARSSWISRWKKGVVTETPPTDVPVINQGGNTHGELGGGERRSELHGGHSRNISSGSQSRSELSGHSRKPSDCSPQTDSGIAPYSGSTAIGSPPTELEAQVPIRHQSPIPEARED